MLDADVQGVMLDLGSGNGYPALAVVLGLLGALHENGFAVIKTEHLYTFDGERGYSLGQGE